MGSRHSHRIGSPFTKEGSVGREAFIIVSGEARVEMSVGVLEAVVRRLRSLEG